MSLTQQTIQRLPTIKAELLKGTSYPDIGTKLGVTERTIDRDIKSFVNSGDFETWLKEEWLRLHNQVIHDDPIEAYRNVSKLISRMITQKREIKEDITVNQRTVEITKVLHEYADVIREESNRTVPLNSTREPLDTANSQNTTT